MKHLINGRLADLEHCTAYEIKPKEHLVRHSERRTVCGRPIKLIFDDGEDIPYDECRSCFMWLAVRTGRIDDE